MSLIELPETVLLSEEEKIKKYEIAKKRFAKIKLSEDIELSDSFLEPPEVPVILQFEDLCYTIKVEKNERQLLKNIGGIVRPGEFLAVMGPTGSGKTTLLNVISDRVTSGEVTGSIKINGELFKKLHKRQFAFVTQDETFLPNLTCEQTLRFQADLQLGHLTSDEKQLRVEKILRALGLEGSRDTCIGSPYSRGVSGGERKRVNIGNELLTHPSLIILDEPTSGLDTSTSLSIIRLLKSLALAGFTVISTIHQPSSQIFALFDKLLVLVDGETVYYGKASETVSYFSSIDLHCDKRYNPADFIMGLILEEELSNKGVSDIKNYLTSKWQKKIGDENVGTIKSKRDKKILKHCQAKQEEYGYPPHGTSWIDQLLILSKRNYYNMKPNLLDKLDYIQTFFTAFIIGFIFYQFPLIESQIDNICGGIFFLLLFIPFSLPAGNAVFNFPAERSVILRERKSGTYQLSAYYLSKLLSTFPFELVHPFISVCIVYPMMGLRGDFEHFLLFMILVFFCVLVSVTFGLSVSACTSPNMKKALTVFVIYFIWCMVVSGFFLQKLPPQAQWIKYLSFFTPVYQGGLLIQFGGTQIPNGNVSTAYDQNSANGIITGDNILLVNNVDPEVMNLGYHILILIGWDILFKIIGFLGLTWSLKKSS